MTNLIFKEKSVKKNDQINLLEDILQNSALTISTYIKEKINLLSKIIDDLIGIRQSKISSFKGAQELEERMFGNIRKQFYENFDIFVEEATRFLAWDVFCNISIKNISTKILRQKQLEYWYQIWKKGILLPIGKIVDDLYQNMKFTSHFSGYGDMADSEMLTLLVFGCLNEDGTIDRCHILTFDTSKEVSERIQLILSKITKIEEELEIKLKTNSGKAHCLFLENNEIYFRSVHEPLIPILL